MDPFSMSGLIASALSVAEIVTGVGMSCRHLQMEFSGALDHIDNISQQINTINLAIQGINLIFQQRPQSFSPSFQSHFGDSVSAVHNTVRRLQDHVQSVKSEAEISKTRAKLTHLRKVAQVRDWGANLMVQTQSLMLLLQVAQLHSNDERTTRLEKASSRDVFEKASSMSTNLTKSSSHLERKNELIKFPFDSVLLESKVYRRACESSWIRDVTTTMGDGRESNSSGSNSILSVSSNGATASEGYCASSPEDLGTSYGRHGGLEPQRGLRFIHDGGFEGRYMVKISDLGLTGPHNSSIDPSGPETRGGTETYGASEVEHHSRGQHKSYSYDIWTIGCICLEFISWLLEGQVGIDSPKISRSTKILHAAIFQVDDGEAARGLPVSMQVQTLRQSMSGLDLPSSGSLRQLVDVVEWYFEMAGSKRPSAAIVASRMRAAQAMWSEEQDSNVHSGTFSGVVEIA